MIAQRAELAQLIGFDTLGQLHHGRQDGRQRRQRLGSSSIAIVAASGPKVGSASMPMLLKRKQQDVPRRPRS